MTGRSSILMHWQKFAIVQTSARSKEKKMFQFDRLTPAKIYTGDYTSAANDRRQAPVR